MIDQGQGGSSDGLPAAADSSRHIPGGALRDASTPYRSSPLFTAETLPPALQREHRTKRGVWGVIRILDGSLRYWKEDGTSCVLDPGTPGLIHPDEPHHVELIGPVSMQVEFYDHEPVGVT